MATSNVEVILDSADFDSKPLNRFDVLVEINLGGGPSGVDDERTYLLEHPGDGKKWKLWAKVLIDREFSESDVDAWAYGLQTQCADSGDADSKRIGQKMLIDCWKNEFEDSDLRDLRVTEPGLLTETDIFVLVNTSDLKNN